MVVETAEGSPEMSKTIENNNDGNSASSPTDDAPIEHSQPPPSSTVIEVLEQFVSEAAVDGLHYVFRESSRFHRWKRALWAALLLTSVGFLIAQMVEVGTDYRDFKVLTSIETREVSEMDFPQVTLCPAVGYDRHRKNVTGIDEPRNEDELHQISFSLEDTIIYSVFNDKNATDSWRPIITSYGLCFTFATDEKVVTPSSVGGLQIWGNIHQDNFTDDSISATVLLIISQKGREFLGHYDSSHNISPGVMSFVRINKQLFERERDTPWSKCQSQAPEYTKPQCLANCYFEALRVACGCRNIGDPDESLPYCTLKDDSECNSEVYSRIGSLDCDCALPPCSEEIFTAQVVNAQFSERFKQTQDEDYLMTSFFYVSVNFDSLRFERLTEAKSMTTSQMLSDLGGLMGLFLGISAISIAEFVGELLMCRCIPRLWGDFRLRGLGSF